MNKQNILVAYFSCTNTTKDIAEKISQATGATLFEIAPAQRYSEHDLDWRDPQSRSSQEHVNPAARPALAGKLDNPKQYDIIFVGYPIWWGEAPRAVNTFLDAMDLSGKIVIPFCTAASSPFGNSGKLLQKTVSPSAKWIEGGRVESGASLDTVGAWAKEILKKRP